MYNASLKIKLKAARGNTESREFQFSKKIIENLF